jgi:hypothetical protein
MRRILYLFVFFLALSPTCAKAQHGDVCTPEKEAFYQPNPKNSVQEAVYTRRRLKMAAIDLNCDGQIDTSEWTTRITQMFQAADIDRDGRLSSNEQQAMVDTYTEDTAKVIGATKIVHSREIQTSLHLLDSNKDGIDTSGEFFDFYNAVFKGMDENHSNTVDIDEFRDDFEGVKRIRN